MAIKKIDVQRFSVVSSRAFNDVLARVQASVGHPDMNTFRREVSAANSFAELEKIVQQATGAPGLMEFIRIDLGEFLRKEYGPRTSQSVRLLVGNPLIMRQMVRHVPDAGSYAPVTILIDERADGVHLSYDGMASFLSPYENPEALKVARDLDAKVEAILTAAAA